MAMYIKHRHIGEKCIIALSSLNTSQGSDLVVPSISHVTDLILFLLLH